MGKSRIGRRCVWDLQIISNSGFDSDQLFGSPRWQKNGGRKSENAGCVVFSVPIFLSAALTDGIYSLHRELLGNYAYWLRGEQQAQASHWHLLVSYLPYPG